MSAVESSLESSLESSPDAFAFPQTVTDAVARLEAQIPESECEFIAGYATTLQFVVSNHYGLGRHIRSAFGLPQNKSLVRDALGNHYGAENAAAVADDASAIILERLYHALRTRYPFAPRHIRCPECLDSVFAEEEHSCVPSAPSPR